MKWIAKKLAQAPHLRQGQCAERAANKYLQRQGCKLLETNYRCRHGEIDLVMQQQDTLVFVEVRYRRRADFGDAAETVDWRKQQKLIASAETYLQQHSSTACRFDVVAVSGAPGNYHMRWIRDAFQA